jgi:hypothetical protein
MLLYTAIEDAALLTLEMFKKRLVVLNANLEKLEKLHAPLDAPPTGLLRLPFEIRSTGLSLLYSPQARY